MPELCSLSYYAICNPNILFTPIWSKGFIPAFFPFDSPEPLPIPWQALAAFPSLHSQHRAFSAPNTGLHLHVMSCILSRNQKTRVRLTQPDTPPWKSSTGSFHAVCEAYQTGHMFSLWGVQEPEGLALQCSLRRNCAPPSAAVPAWAQTLFTTTKGSPLTTLHLCDLSCTQALKIK